MILPQVDGRIRSVVDLKEFISIRAIHIGGVGHQFSDEQRRIISQRIAAFLSRDTHRLAHKGIHAVAQPDLQLKGIQLRDIRCRNGCRKAAVFVSQRITAAIDQRFRFQHDAVGIDGGAHHIGRALAECGLCVERKRVIARFADLIDACGALCVFQRARRRIFIIRKRDLLHLAILIRELDALFGLGLFAAIIIGDGADHLLTVPHDDLHRAFTGIAEAIDRINGLHDLYAVIDAIICAEIRFSDLGALRIGHPDDERLSRFDHGAAGNLPVRQGAAIDIADEQVIHFDVTIGCIVKFDVFKCVCA